MGRKYRFFKSQGLIYFVGVFLYTVILVLVVWSTQNHECDLTAVEATVDELVSQFFIDRFISQITLNFLFSAKGTVKDVSWATCANRFVLLVTSTLHHVPSDIDQGENWLPLQSGRIGQSP